MKRSLLSGVLFTFLVIVSAPEGFSYRILYKEQLWNLYHQQLYMYPLDIAENIHWLEQALRADFANPLYALSKIENPQEWEKYRYLFSMHINLTLVDLYLQWASKHMKFEPRFFNYPWREANLESFDKAQTLLEFALIYWDEAKRYSDMTQKFPWLFLTEVQYWEDENFRIQTGSLDYAEIIQRHLSRLDETRQFFASMDESTY
ncbi:MAG: hypothetical protein GW949_10405 [Spirochaetales bacterium]|nr:hypothetical protein [Spirochaetales bacterium]